MTPLQTYPAVYPEAIIRAQQDERERIGHELHDNVNQILTSAHLYLTVLTRDCPEFEDVRKRTIDILQMGIEAIRQLSKEMVMFDLKEEGLIGSISNLVKDLYKTKLFNILFIHSDASRVEALDKCRKIALFRVVQEQVKNIIKYSQSKNIQIALHCMDDQIRLLVRDDGIGFDPATTKKGLGLSNIYERAMLYKGKVLLDSAPGRGCSLIVNIPYFQPNLY
ncbi:MAG TPA: ATP-binding protein [Puia sp.]|jgi:signal transduction histidine kinase|nr:ATP-binding protein [Puia sp.]